ncbi:MAG: hypothetical protein JWO31_4006 [Phycisphaerales bacterium]|nr:hypothetical protein [Phycisphaerales bacterium]
MLRPSACCERPWSDSGAKFQGSAVAMAMAMDGRIRLNLAGAHDCLQEGNVLCCRVLEETGPYVSCDESERVLGDRLKPENLRRGTPEGQDDEADDQ